jgi:hypothetical protein
VGDGRFAEEVALVLGVEDGRVDVVAGEGPDRVDRVPERQAMNSVRSPWSRRSIQAPRLPGVSAYSAKPVWWM